MRGRYYSQVDVKFQHDWQQCQRTLLRLLELEPKVERYQFGDADHYDLKSLGTISKHRTSDRWYRVAGPAIAGTLPWLSGMLESMRSLEPDDGCISYLAGDGAGHRDLPHLRTALNYIIQNEDPAAETWVEHEGHKESYPSVTDTSWLLNTQCLHGITNRYQRWTLSIHFNTDYDLVREWFDSHPGLIYGNQKG